MRNYKLLTVITNITFRWRFERSLYTRVCKLCLLLLVFRGYAAVQNWYATEMEIHCHLSYFFSVFQDGMQMNEYSVCIHWSVRGFYTISSRAIGVVENIESWFYNVISLQRSSRSVLFFLSFWNCKQDQKKKKMVRNGFFWFEINSSKTQCSKHPKENWIV